MDKFNRVFQKSSENTTCMLFSETCRLLRLYASNLLKSHVIIAAGDNLKDLSLDRRGQLTLCIGAATWSCLTELESSHDIKPFFTAVRKFYCETKKCRRNFLLMTR